MSTEPGGPSSIPVLSPFEARVLGCLIEKEMATPEYYPLSLNALAAACNQTNNRDPVMRLDEKEVVRVLDALREKGLAWEVTVSGSRVPKYKHRATERFGLAPVQAAVLCELLVRGPQTAGELKTRAGRMAPIESVEAAQSALESLAARAEGPLVARLAREPGKREPRHAHLLCGPVAAPAASATAAPEPARLAVQADDARVAALEAEVRGLREQVAALASRLDRFMQEFK